MIIQEPWQLKGDAPRAYEDHKVQVIFKPLAELTLQHIQLQKNDRILDAACGTGIVGRLIARNKKGMGKVVGVDLNPEMIAVACKLVPEEEGVIEWKVSDVAALPFTDNTFDVVLCQQGLQFFPNKISALKELRRVLAPNGKIVMTIWSSSSPLFNSIASALARYIDDESAIRSLAPFTLTDPEEIKALFSEAGYQGIRMQLITVVRRIGPIEKSVPKEITASPLAARFARLDDGIRAAIANEVGESLQDFRDGNGFAIPQHSHLVQAFAS